MSLCYNDHNTCCVSRNQVRSACWPRGRLSGRLSSPRHERRAAAVGNAILPARLQEAETPAYLCLFDAAAPPSGRWQSSRALGGGRWNLRPAESVVNNNFFMRRRRLPAPCEGLMGGNKDFSIDLWGRTSPGVQAKGGSVWSVGEGLKLLRVLMIWFCKTRLFLLRNNKRMLKVMKCFFPVNLQVETLLPAKVASVKAVLCCLRPPSENVIQWAVQISRVLLHNTQSIIVQAPDPYLLPAAFTAPLRSLPVLSPGICRPVHGSRGMEKHL